MNIYFLGIILCSVILFVNVGFIIFQLIQLKNNKTVIQYDEKQKYVVNNCENVQTLDDISDYYDVVVASNLKDNQSQYFGFITSIRYEKINDDIKIFIKTPDGKKIYFKDFIIE